MQSEDTNIQDTTATEAIIQQTARKLKNAGTKLKAQLVQIINSEFH